MIEMYKSMADPNYFPIEVETEEREFNRETLSKPLKLAESYEPLHSLLLQHLKQTIIFM